MLKGIRHVLLQKDSPKQKALTIRRLSPCFFIKNSFKIIMALEAHFDLELHQMDVKIAFFNGCIEEEIYICNRKILKRKVHNIWFAN